MSNARPNVELYRSSPGPFRGRPQMWRFRWRADNGRIIATGSESYTNREDAVSAIQLLWGKDVAFSEPELVEL